MWQQILDLERDFKQLNSNHPDLQLQMHIEDRVHDMVDYIIKEKPSVGRQLRSDLMYGDVLSGSIGTLSTVIRKIKTYARAQG